MRRSVWEGPVASGRVREGPGGSGRDWEGTVGEYVGWNGRVAGWLYEGAPGYGRVTRVGESRGCKSLNDGA